MDQTDLGDRMAILMVTVRIGGRSLPLTWVAEEGSANIGFAKQKILLDQVLAWIPADAKVMLLADRFTHRLICFAGLIATIGNIAYV